MIDAKRDGEGATPALVVAHPFRPRREWVAPPGDGLRNPYLGPVGDLRSRPPNRWLCQDCNLAEAAHAATTEPYVPRGA